jgi:hypothetical protein
VLLHWGELVARTAGLRNKVTTLLPEAANGGFKGGMSSATGASERIVALFSKRPIPAAFDLRW